MIPTLNFLAFVFFALLVKAEPETIKIDGSSGVHPLLKPIAKQFQKQHPKLTIHLNKGLNPKKRLEQLVSGEIDIAMASHGVDIETISEKNLSLHLFARMKIVFAVHKSVAIQSLSDLQLAAIYGGEINNWKQLGGADLPIVKLMRPETEVDTEILRKHLTPFKSIKWSKDVRIKTSSGDLAKALDSTEGAIGLTTLVRTHQAKNMIPLRLISPNSESQRLTRNCYLVTKSAPSKLIKSFTDFVVQSHLIIINSGAIAIDPLVK